MHTCLIAAVGGLLLPLVLAEPAHGQEWTRFRGPNGSGCGAAPAVPDRWAAKDYRWKVELPGVGHSSPVLWGERVFVTGAVEKTGRRFVLCLRATDGQRLWLRDFAGTPHGKHEDNSFASATPAVDERHVYLLWGGPKELLAVALDHDGREVWRTDLGSFQSGHGFGASPIVHEGLVIIPQDQDGPSALIALDRATGKVRWKLPRKSRATYTTPCVYRPADGPAEILFTNYEHGVTSVAPDTGRVNWELDVFDKRHVEAAIGSPVVAGDVLLASAGWLGVRQEVVAVQLVPGGRADKPRVLYRINRAAPLCTTPLVTDGLLFLWGDGGIVTCADVRTGAVHWRERVPGSYYGSPVCVGRRLINVSRDGDAVVLAAARQYELLARNPVGEGSHSTAAVAGGRLYIRTFTHLMAVGGRPAEE